METNWIIFSLGAAVSFSFMLLITKKLMLENVSPLIVNLLLFALAFLGFAAIAVYTKAPVNLSGSVIILFIIAAVLSIIGNQLNMEAIKSAPNPGYASTIVSSQVIVMTIASVFLFGSSFALPQVIGILLVILGTAVISLC